MLKFRPSNIAQKRNVSFNEVQLIALIEKGLSDNALRGFLYKRSSPTAKWRMKWFLLFENLLFYFDLTPTNQPGSSGKSPNKGSTLSSLIRRQSNRASREGAHVQRNSSSGPVDAEPRRASVSESLEIGRRLGELGTLGAGRCERGDLQPETARDGSRLGGQSYGGCGERVRGRKRLSSDPQSAAVSALDSLSLDYEHANSKTLHSSSISGVSGHFLAHNEQTIGRSTTTAGKTANSANYSSLLSRKIGVIFLEGSYCEKLIHSPANFSGGPRSMQMMSRSGGCKNSQGGGDLLEASQLAEHLASSKLAKNEENESELQCIFTLTWRKEGSKEYQFRTETEAECLTWTHAISNARYSTLLEEKEQLEQKYLHLSQIVESESTAKWQYSRQCEELSAEIKKLRQEICELKRQESRSNHLRLVLSKSAAIVESIVRQQRRKARQQQQQRLELDGALSEAAEEEGSSELGARPSSAEPVEQPVVQPTVAGSSAGGLLKRARSMDQEQAEQEMAVRRTARRSHLQRASAKADSQRRSEALSMLVRSASMRQSAGVECASLAAVTAAPTANESLDVELDSVVEALNKGILLSGLQFEVENGEELRKIKKVQGFFRGWLCRRRWKQIVQEYIKSPHAESMRKRNNLVFRMVECEEEYVEQLTQLISAFLRPIKMAASSQRPPLSHDELNSIFLNSETLLFLHQIFLKGLTARMESWPTLVLADLFNMLLPMLTIYQEYVRNHHFSLQVLAECKQRAQFAQLLRRLEEKSQLNGRTLETFLTYPMHQIPRYIICLHEILAHTPHNHVERKSLYEAQTKLEELSQQMHDEVSETENIRQNLAIERMIIGGCDILLDVNQVFVRQGILLQVLTEASKPVRPRSRLASFASPRRSTADCQLPPHLPTNSAGYSHTNQSCDNQSRELVRQCFLFTNHLLLCTRTNDGKLHLLESVGRIELTEVTLIENPLEFIQQQEIMAAETAPNRNNRTKDSSCNSIWDYHSGCAPDGVASDKRASTASEPSKWPHTNQLETSRSRDKQQPAQVESHGLRVNSVFSVGASFSSPLEVTVPHETRQPGNSRGRIAGYLATKLSNLANLGGSGAQQQHRASGASSSAPPSPLNKRSNQELSANQTRRSTASALGERLLEQHKDYAGCDFILLLDSNSRSANHSSINGVPIMVHLVAPNLQEKAAWMSDISQCIDNVHFNDIFHGSVNDSTNVTMNQSVRNDPRLYKDDVDIKFSRTLNSCKLPQIRYASKERLFERLTDLRFLSIDFLNTFLLTYRVFTTAEDVLEALKSVHYNCDRYYQQQLCRESFSAFDYSSLSSLNNSTQTVEAVNKAQLGVDQKAEASPKIVSPVPVVLSDKRKDIELHHRSRRPTVPVRSSAKEAIFIGQNEGTKFLLAPNCLHQKRRSTISALTPITGSTSSSLANLSSTHKTNLQQPSSNPVPAADLESNTLVNRGDNSCQSNNDLTLFNDDNQKQLNLTPDRCSPSSSMIQTEHTDLEMQVRTNLDVPGRGRQVRASSLSHVSGAQLREAVRRDQNQDNSIGNEHWRLSYKKAIDSSSTLAAKNLLSAAKCGPTRRASSSDANITFHITLEPPPVETKVSDDEFASSRSCYHSVPPPSPSGPPSDASQLSSLKRPSSNRTTANDRTSLSDKNITNDKLPVDMNETSVHNSRRIKKRHHHHRKRRLNRHNSDSSLTTNDSSTQLSSSSISTGSVISSQSESDLIQSTSSRDSTDSDSSQPGGVDTLTNLSENRVDVPIRSARRQQSMPFTVKEIELTESKTLDCDTSADEDKVSTSSGDEHNRILSDSDDQEYDYENEDDESFRLLSRLNSVKISKREFECDKPCLEPDKKSVGSFDAQKTSKAAKDRMTEEVTTGKRRSAKRRTNKIKKSGKLRRSVKTSNKKDKTRASAEQTYPFSDTIVHNDAVQLDVMADISSSGTKELTNESKPCFDVTAVIDDTSKVETQRKETQSEQASEVGYASQRLHNSNVGLQSSDPGSRMTTPRNSFQYHNADVADRISKAGVIVTSSSPRVSSRRSSTASAASAFAAATAASNNPLLTHPPQSLKTSSIASSPRKLSSDIQRHNFDPSNQTDAISCLCFNFQRQPLSAQSSNQTLVGNQLTRIQSRQSELINNRVSSANSSGTTAGQQQQLSMAHHPSCIYFQQLAACSPSNTPSNYCPNMPSDASLCNSRASSRLSSCAGLDYSTYSSQTNFYTMQHQQQHFAPSSNQVGSPVHIRGQQQTARGCHATQQARLGTYLENRTVTNNSSKRNSSQINIRSVATIRVLSVLRHWVSKHSQDFVNDTKLTNLVQEFIQDLIMDPNLLPAEHKAAIQLQQMVQKANQLRGNRVDLDVLLASPSKPSPDSIETLSALEVAETMTYLDHKIFLAIRSEEFLGQAWMKLDKAIKAPHILLITKRFNDVSRLVSSEIIRVPELSRRVAIIEKWANVAHICRVVHNFNGVLQICAAFTNSAVFRLEKTWDKIPKTTKTTIDQLQSLVSTDSRFRNMRDAINRCDPPSIPYVGMYLTDLSFIEEGTPNYSPEGLLNFSKMRMIAHVIREIQHLQNGSYKIELNHKVANYLLDSSRHLQDDEMYRCSLAIEPRSTGGKNGAHLLNNAVNQQAPVAPSVPAAMKPSMTWLTSKT